MGSGGGLDMGVVSGLFSQALAADNEDVDILLYCQAYMQLVKVFDKLGALFGFVKSDVAAKTRELTRLHTNDPEHYSSSKTMVAYEAEKGKSRKTSSGTVNLLRLHRALEFVVKVIQDLVQSPLEEGSMSHLVRENYNHTLYKHHTVIVRGLCTTAFLALPSKRKFVESTFGAENREEAMRLCLEAASNAQIAYDRVETIYARANLLDIP